MPLLVSFRFDENNEKRQTDYSQGYINITVESNINRLFFRYNLKGSCLSAIDSTVAGSGDNPSCPRIVVPVKDFECTSHFVYKDFLTLLKAERFPFLEIDLPDNTEINYISGDTVILRGVTLSVAGVSKKYDINCKIKKISGNIQILNGTTRLKLTDLDIDPPVKSFGLVKVKNEIIINFGFCLNGNGKGIYST